MAKVPLEAEATSGPFLGKLHLTFEDVYPERFPEYVDSMAFLEWFGFIFLKKRSLIEAERIVREAGGVVLAEFVNDFNNEFNKLGNKIVGIEAKQIGPIIRLY